LRPIVVLERTSPLPLMNPGFEDKKLAITDNPAALLQYRDQVGDCLERCVQALGPGDHRRYAPAAACTTAVL